MCCYIPVVGWIAAIVVLASPRFERERHVRFHAFQGIYIFVVWLLVDWVIAPMFGMMRHGPASRLLISTLELGVLAAWVVMLVKASQEELYRLPIVGELAERSLAEQR